MVTTVRKGGLTGLTLVLPSRLANMPVVGQSPAEALRTSSLVLVFLYVLVLSSLVWVVPSPHGFLMVSGRGHA